MKLRQTITPLIFNAKSIQDDLFPYFGWLGAWRIQVSGGLQIPLGNLLVDIQDILGVQPNLSFLRIVEEQKADEFFIRKLRVFIELNDKNHEKYEAVQYAINKAERASEEVCYRCGDKLQHEIPVNDDDLAYYVSKHNIEKYIVQFMKVCTRCVNSTSKERIAEKIETNGKPIEKMIKKEQQTKKEAELVKLSTDIIPDVQQEKDNKKTEKEEQGNSKNMLDTSHVIFIYKAEELDKLEENYKGASREQEQRVKSLSKRLRESTPEKILVSIPGQWQQHCDALQHNFPNFSEVTQFIRHQFALSNVSDNRLRLPPFLLVGDAGIGKTEYMLTLANLCNTTLEVIDISSAQSGSTLSGSENFWGNTKTGLIFNSLMFSDIANPIIMLDEIDKTSESSAYQPLAALHGLLEARQAKQFKDLSVPEISIDASYIIWIATANSVDSIERPILDRFLIFHVGTPTPQQMRNIVSNQYHRYLEQSAVGRFFEAEIRSDVVDELCKYHPRSVKKRLNLAFGFAANQQRNYLTVNDIQNNKLNEEGKKRGVGFMSADI